MSMVKKRTSYLKKRILIPRLTVKELKIYCANNITNSQLQKFDYIDALVDGAIINGLTFFGTIEVLLLDLNGCLL